MPRPPVPLPQIRTHLAKGPAAPQIADDLKARILGEQYVSGDPLPSVTGWAEFYERSEPTVAKGFDLLVKEGWLMKEAHKGYIVATVIPPVKSVLAEESTEEMRAVALTRDEHSVVEAKQQHGAIICQCPTCDAWAALTTDFPKGIIPTCETDKTPMITVRLDPAKRL